VLIKNPPENLIASFNFTSVVLDEGTMFTFGSWFCIANMSDPGTRDYAHGVLFLG
jgi:hypothetical protein